MTSRSFICSVTPADCLTMARLPQGVLRNPSLLLPDRNYTCSRRNMAPVADLVPCDLTAVGKHVGVPAALYCSRAMYQAVLPLPMTSGSTGWAFVFEEEFAALATGTIDEKRRGKRKPKSSGSPIL